MSLTGSVGGMQSGASRGALNLSNLSPALASYTAVVAVAGCFVDRATWLGSPLQPTLRLVR